MEVASREPVSNLGTTAPDWKTVYQLDTSVVVYILSLVFCSFYHQYMTQDAEQLTEKRRTIFKLCEAHAQ